MPVQNVSYPLLSDHLAFSNLLLRNLFFTIFPNQSRAPQQLRDVVMSFLRRQVQWRLALLVRAQIRAILQQDLHDLEVTIKRC